MNLEKLISVFNALNQVQVSGYQNYKLMAASMQLIEEVIKDMQDKPVE